MHLLERFENSWRICAGGLELNIERKTGCLSRLAIVRDKQYVWSEHAGDVTVRDDRLERTFGSRHLDKVHFKEKENALVIHKTFLGASWRLTEIYSVDDDGLAWNAHVEMADGDFRSCAITYHVPWPRPQSKQGEMMIWAAREGMPTALHRHAGVSLEYGEVTSGIVMPAMAAYLEKSDAGLLLFMPFDFKTPRLRYLMGLRDPELQAQFDWLALSPGNPARVCLRLRGMGGAWRPALGWLAERYKEFFEPRSTAIHNLWGGHVSGRCDVSLADARKMKRLGLRWHEIHQHFPAYGNYHPEEMKRWKTGHHPLRFPKWITENKICRTIQNLHAVGAAALPYLQVSGDGAAKSVASTFDSSRVRDIHGEAIYNDYYDIEQMNSDPSLPFGKDIVRQIKGMVGRYPEMDGVFLDQACYNFVDTAHHDGLTAIDNRPCYMTGFNYEPHLELLSLLLHPGKVIIANGPFGIGIMKYIDGFMAEGSGWLCDQFQYYGLAKPMFFLIDGITRRDIEQMFQRCLLYGAGFSSYIGALPCRDLYAKYLPVLERLYRRRWVFDPSPLMLPTAFKGNLFRSERGTLIASLISDIQCLQGRSISGATVAVCACGTERVKEATLYVPGLRPQSLSFSNKDGIIQFDVPVNLTAGLVEMS